MSPNASVERWTSMSPRLHVIACGWVRWSEMAYILEMSVGIGMIWHELHTWGHPLERGCRGVGYA